MFRMPWDLMHNHNNYVSCYATLAWQEARLWDWGSDLHHTILLVQGENGIVTLGSPCNQQVGGQSSDQRSQLREHIRVRALMYPKAGSTDQLNAILSLGGAVEPLTLGAPISCQTPARVGVKGSGGFEPNKPLFLVPGLQWKQGLLCTPMAGSGS